MAEDSLIHIQDKRPAATEKANFTGKYDRGVIQAIIENAIRMNVNPHTALAMSLQENRLGKDTGGVGWGSWNTPKGYYDSEDNRKIVHEAYESRNKYSKVYDQIKEIRDEVKGEMGDLAFDTAEYKKLQKAMEENSQAASLDPAVLRADVSHFIANMRDKFSYARNVYGNSIPESMIIQAYNGFGKIKGSDGRIIDAAKEHPYGKRVIALRDYAIRNNPEINNIINLVQRGIQPPGVIRQPYQPPAFLNAEE